MSLRITQLPSDDKLPRDFSLHLLEQIYPRELICDLLTRFGRWETRERKLNQVVMIYLLIAWSFFLRCSLRSVFLHLTAALRLLAGLSAQIIPTPAALTYRRKQLGVRIMRTLFRCVARPLATENTKGAFAFGLRLMAIDGTLEDVADTPANAAFFGRICEGTTQSPFPQIRCVHLVEGGTHAIVDTIAAPCHADKRRLSWGLLRSLTPGMLLLNDRGFVSGAFFEAVHQRGAQILGRLSQGVFTRHEQDLGDGSYLTTLTAASCAEMKGPLQVRVIEYTITPKVADQLVNVTPSRMHSNGNGTNPDVRKVHRLVTTLLDPLAYPALDLCLLYHERWEIELVIDETKNHLRLSQAPLRSKLPLLALQEFYAILLAHFVVRSLIMHTAQTQEDLDPDRISFTLCLQEVKSALILSTQTQPEQISFVLSNISACLVLPQSLLEPRRLRFNCRVVKHICTRFRRKRPHHHNVTLRFTTFSDILRI